MHKRPKISVIGAGNIGGTVAHLLSLRGIYSVALVDINDSLAKGKILDISQSSPVEGFEPNLIAGSDYKITQDSDAVIITAGVPRKPGMTRDDLISVNAKIISDISKNIKAFCPNAFIVVITNPLDAMVYHLQKCLNSDSSKIVGMAGVLDSARFKSFLSEALSVSIKDIQALVLGGHGNSMVPLKNCTTVSGIPLSNFVSLGMITEEAIDAIIQRTRSAGLEIVELLKTGSAFYSPASSSIEMVESYLLDKRKLLACSAMLSNGEYGVKEKLYVGVPCIIGCNGVEKVLEVPLTDEEKKMFTESVESVKGLVDSLPA